MRFFSAIARYFALFSRSDINSTLGMMRQRVNFTTRKDFKPRGSEAASVMRPNGARSRLATGADDAPSDSAAAHGRGTAHGFS
jgi:hypothetical protein